MSDASCCWCNDPATHVFLRDGESMCERCERCARENAAHSRGEAYAGLEMLGLAVKLLHDAGMAAEDILAAARGATDTAGAFSEPVAPNGPDWQMAGFDHDDRFIRIPTSERDAG